MSCGAKFAWAGLQGLVYMIMQLGGWGQGTQRLPLTRMAGVSSAASVFSCACTASWTVAPMASAYSTISRRLRLAGWWLSRATEEVTSRSPNLL